MLIWKRRRLTSLTLPAQVLILFAVFFMAFAMRANLNIGVRHALPVFPAAIILVALVINRLRESGKLIPRLAAGLLCAEAAVAAVTTYPHHLGFFNLLTGGPSYGTHISIVAEDWGQDTKDVARWFAKKGIEVYENEEEVNLVATNQKLVELETKVGKAKNEHNKFLIELGLPPLP